MCLGRTVLPVALASGEGPCWMLNCWWINMGWPAFKAAMTNVPSGHMAAQPFLTQLAQGKTREHLYVAAFSLGEQSHVASDCAHLSLRLERWRSGRSDKYYAALETPKERTVDIRHMRGWRCASCSWRRAGCCWTFAIGRRVERGGKRKERERRVEGGIGGRGSRRRVKAGWTGSGGRRYSRLSTRHSLHTLWARCSQIPRLPPVPPPICPQLSLLGLHPPTPTGLRVGTP